MADLKYYDITNDEIRPATQTDLDRMQFVIQTQGKFIVKVREALRDEPNSQFMEVVIRQALNEYEHDKLNIPGQLPRVK